MITPEISLNGLVYWLAYDKKLESWPTVTPPCIATKAPQSPTLAYTMAFTNRVQGFVSEEKN